MRLALLCVLLFLWGSHALAPIGYTFESASFEVNGEGGQPMMIDVAVIQVEFDAAVFVAQAEADPVPYQELDFPQTQLAVSAVNLTCDDGEYTVAGNTEGVMLAPGTPEPAVTFLGLFGDFQFDETPRNDVIVVVFITKFGDTVAYATPEDFLAANPVLSFPGIVSATGAAVSDSVEVLTHTPPECSVESIAHALDLLQQITDGLLSVKSSEEMRNIDMAKSAMASSRAWQGCQAQFSSLLSYEEVTVTQSQSTRCNAEYNSTEWREDPCCNWELGRTMCCRPRAQEFVYQAVSGVDTDTITDLCPNYITEMEGLLTDLAQILKADGTPVNSQDVFDTFKQYSQTCRDDIWNQECDTDADCVYSGDCDRNRNQCNVKVDEMFYYMAACLVSEMTDEHFTELSSLWSLPATADTAETVAAVQAKLEELVADFDCVGSNAWEFAAGWEEVQDEQGRTQWQPKPADEAGCLGVMKCNWKWLSEGETEADCSGETVVAALGDHFCGFPSGQGDDLWPMGQRATCELRNIISPEVCTAAGGVMYSQWQGDNDHCYLIMDTPGPDACFSDHPLYDAAETAASPWGPQPWYVSQSHVAILGVTDAECTTADDTTTLLAIDAGYWKFFTGGDVGNCIFTTQARDEFQAAFEAAGIATADIVNWAERWFMKGMFDTAETCTSSCSLWEYRYDGVTQTICEGAQQCDVSCARCEARSRLEGTWTEAAACYDETISSGDCSQRSGASYDETLGAAGACWWKVATADECAGDSETFFSCDSVAEADCNGESSNLQQSLQCTWNERSTCKDEAACNAAGACNDWEFQNFDWQTGTSREVCVVPGECPDNSNWQYYSYSWTLSACIYKTYSEAACTAAEGTWAKAATTEAECNAHGEVCKGKEGWINQRVGDECTDCEGTFVPAYKWHSGISNAGVWITLSWTPREMVPANQFISTVSYFKLDEELQKAAGRSIARGLSSALSKTYGSFLNVMTAAACACSGADSADNCFCDATGSTDAQCAASTAATASCAGDCASITTTADSFTASDSVADIQTLCLGAGLASGAAKSCADSASPAFVKKSKRSHHTQAIDDVSVYRVIANEYSAVVGQLIGSGTAVQASGGLTSFELCLTISLDIPTDPAYTVYDLAASADLDNVTPGVPLGLTVVVSDVEVCANVTETGVYYYPVLLDADWATLGEDSSSTGDDFASAAVSAFRASVVFFASLFALLPVFVAFF